MKTVHHDQCPLCQSSRIQPAFEVKDHSISGETFPLFDCQDCGFRFTQDAPAPEMVGKYYQSEDYISHSDNKTGIVNRMYHAARDYMLGRKEQLVAAVSPGQRVLDYGTGTGYFVDYLRRRGYAVEGVEIAEDARNYGRQKFGVTIHAPEYLSEKLPAASYDAITMWHVLEHLYDPYDYLATFRRLLADEGTLIVAVPNNDSKDAEHYGPQWAAYDVPRHLWHFTPTTMEEMMSRAGFQIEATHHMPMDPFYVSIMSEKYSGGGLISGGIKGLQSFVGSTINPRRGSSVIYVLRKSSLAANK